MLVFTQRGYEDQFRGSEVFRDNTATIVALGEGREQAPVGERSGRTGLTPITKLMAHLPLAFLGHPPKNALVVCFGMGTTYGSLLSWDIVPPWNWCPAFRAYSGFITLTARRA